MSKRYELIIFDWDGTLVDSADEIVKLIQQSIAVMGLPEREDRQIRRLIGLGLEDAFSHLFPEMALSELMQLEQQYRHLFGARSSVYGRAFAGVDDSLEELADAQYRLAVATGKSRRGLDKALAATAWGTHFEATRCADETASKPNPKMLQELLQELDLPAERALMVGDTSYDMEMAARIGMDSVGVAWGVHEAEELSQAGACLVLPGVNDLSAWLQ